MMDDKKFMSILQIFLLVFSTIAYSYLVSAAFEPEQKVDGSFLEIYGKIVKFIFGEDDLVSAFGVGDILKNVDPVQALGQIKDLANSGTSICIETVNNQKCQKMPTSSCASDCKPGKCEKIANSLAEDFALPSECTLGTCQDPDSGICLPNSPRADCENNGGKWFDDPSGNFAECERACCIIGSEVSFTTELQCQKTAESFGVDFPSDGAKFDSELKQELACLVFAERELKGACTIEMNEKEKDCKFVSRSECDELGWNFEGEGILCSNPDLNTVCMPKNHTSCLEGADEIYWFDSCGNIENIYGTNERGKEGTIISKGESCEIGDADNWLKNQGSCGNCNRILSSTCGEKTETERLVDPNQDVVCRDLGCDDNGKRRENGESWCDYQSNFGVFPIEVPFAGTAMSYAPGGTQFLGGLINARSMGPPGSQFFRKYCNAGKIEVENCEQSRNGICIESRITSDVTNKEIQVASCRINRWQECVNYNPPDRGEGIVGKIKVGIAMAKCDADIDCFVKNVAVGKDFTFPICLPKYPPGFNLGDGDSGGESVCALGSQTCPAIFVKEAVAFGFGGAKWVCKANCECVDGDDPDTAMPSQKFVKEMSDTCVSLGDCGIKLNYQGKPGGIGGFSVKKCVTEDIEGDCKNDIPVVSTGTVAGIAISTGLQLADIKAPPRKYIDGSDYAKFERSRGQSNVLSKLLGGSEEFLSDYQSSGGGDPNYDLGYNGEDLVWVGAVPGAAALGFYGVMQTGLLSTTTYSLVLHSAGPYAYTSLAGAQVSGTIPITGFSTTSSAEASAAVANVQGQVGETGMVAVTSHSSVAPAAQAFSGALTGAAIAVAAVTLIIGFSGIARGLGEAGTYFYTGLGAAGGGLAGYALSQTFAAGAEIPAGTVLAEGSILGGGSTVTSGTAIASTGEVIGAGGAVPAGATATVSSGGATVGTGATAGAAQATGSGAAAASGGAAGPGTAAAAGATTLLAVAIVILVVVFTMLILNIVMGVGDMKKVEVTAECKPWAPPIASSDLVCNQCGSDGFPCNEYACESLGANCGLVGEHPNVTCVDMSPNDVAAPKISKFDEALQEGFRIVDLDNGFKIEKKNSNSKCLEDFETVRFGVKTDEYSVCKFGLKPETAFDEMFYLGGDNSYLKEHYHLQGSLEIVNYFNGIGEPLEPEKETEVAMYVKCQDAKGNTNSQPYPVKLCVVRKDLTPPLLVSASDTALPYGTTESQVFVRSNEPVELRWSFSDVSFDEMENRFVCPLSESITDCWANVPIETDSVTIYVRGKDHPEWIGTDKEGDRNVDEQSLVITLGRSESELKIDSISPADGDKIRTGLLTASVNLEVHVSGGDLDSASCYAHNGIDLLDKVSRGVYRKVYDKYSAGKHKIQVECEDKVGNKVEKEISFEVVKDSTFPEVTRVYDNAGTLVVITKEDAVCSFVRSSKCNFKVSDGEEMNGNELVHTTLFDAAQTYGIKCKDEFGNEPSKCNLVVSGGKI